MEERSRIGDWEADTIVGRNHKQAIVTVIERKTGLVKIKRVTKKSAHLVVDAMVNMLIQLDYKLRRLRLHHGVDFAR